MAEAFFEPISRLWNTVSAGIRPDKKIRPLTIEVLKSVRIDVSQRNPKPLTNRMLRDANLIIAMDSYVLSKMPRKHLLKTQNWKITSLLGKQPEQVRQIRDQTSRKVERLSKELSSQP
jgi:protein-tyrosine-phosphatase